MRTQYSWNPRDTYRYNSRQYVRQDDGSFRSWSLEFLTYVVWGRLANVDTTMKMPRNYRLDTPVISLSPVMKVAA